jgi:hypothetical protein
MQPGAGLHKSISTLQLTVSAARTSRIVHIPAQTKNAHAAAGLIGVQRTYLARLIKNLGIR